MRYVVDNIFNSKEDILVHQVNCLGVMGAGVALQIKNRYPQVFSEYEKMCTAYQKDRAMLGLVQLIPVDNKRIICNAFGQHSIGTAVQQTDYKALISCFTQLNKIGKSIAIPYRMGCGLGGGKWENVVSIIERACPDIEVVIYQRPEDVK